MKTCKNVTDFFFDSTFDKTYYHITNSIHNFLFDVDGIKFNFVNFMGNDKVSFIITNRENLNKIKEIKNKNEFFNKVYMSLIDNIKNNQSLLRNDEKEKKLILNSSVYFCDITGEITDNLFSQIDSKNSLNLKKYNDIQELTINEGNIDTSDLPSEFRNKFSEKYFEKGL